MPLALCTALQFSMIMFSTDVRLPIMYVKPEILASDATAFAVHTPQGDDGHTKGHYDYAVPFDKGSGSTDCHLPKSISCRCGANRKDETIQSCKPLFYATRCKCLKASKLCISTMEIPVGLSHSKHSLGKKGNIPYNKMFL